MKKWLTLSKVLFFGLCIFLVLLLCTNIALRHLAQVKYKKLVNDQEFVRAFVEHDQEAKERMRRQYGLEYQYLEQGKVVDSSHPKLPRYRITRILFATEPNVLPTDVSQSLKQMLPYTITLQKRLFIVFPLISSSNADKDAGYLVFLPLFP